MDMIAKKTKGKQKIEMKKIEKDTDRMVTFSKRKAGIFKKASDLSTLCGAQVGILIFSPTGKPSTFGHPTFDYVATRYRNNNNVAQTDQIYPLVEAQRKVKINELNQQFEDPTMELEAQNDREKILARKIKGKEIQPVWWDKRIENELELQEMRSSLFMFHESLTNKIKERIMATNSSLVRPSTFSFGFGNGSGGENASI